MSYYVNLFLDTAFVFQDLMVLNKEAETVYNTMGCDENTRK